LVAVGDITRAADRLQDIIHRTELTSSRTLSELSGTDVYLKPENVQRTGSFKIRGAYNFVASLDPVSGCPGVVAASAGNHAQGVAYAAARAGLASTVVMPVRTPISKVAATRSYGADVRLHGAIFDDCYELARRIESDTGAVFIHAFDDERVIAGAGTVGREIITDLPDVDAIVVPVGGGGLISGIAVAAAALKPETRIIGVEAEGAACVTRSLRARRRCTVEAGETIADGISVKIPGELPFSIIRRYVHDVVTVDDDEIASAVLLLLQRGKMVAEGAGAASVAALLHDRAGLRGDKVAAVISGGNIDVNFISRIIDKGLVKNGMRARLTTVVPDRPGSLQQLLRIVADCGANVLSVDHDRLDVGVPLRDVEVDFALETRGQDHVREVVESLQSRGYAVTVK